MSVILKFFAEKALGTETDENGDDHSEWLIIGDFASKDAFAIAFSNYMFGYEEQYWDLEQTLS